VVRDCHELAPARTIWDAAAGLLPSGRWPLRQAEQRANALPREYPEFNKVIISGHPP